MQIEFSTGSYPGQIPQEGAGRLINAIAEKMGDDLKYVRSPGVIRWATPPPADNVTNFRGGAYLGNTLWVAYQNSLYQSTAPAGGILTKVPDPGAVFLGGDPVFFTQNMRATAGGPDIIAAQANGGAYVLTPGAVTVHPSTGGNLPVAQVVDVTFGLGFFFYGISDGRVFASGLNSTSVNAVDFTTANTKPDGLYRVVWFGQQLYICGPDSIEVWGQPINATGFPLNLVTTIPRGIVGPRGITGFENGFDLGLVFCSKNNQIMRLNGYQPERISVPDLERRIALITDNSLIELTVFNVGGHMFLKVKSPVWTWIYDFSTQTWHERQSWLSLTSRMKQCWFAFGNVWLCGDENSADIGLITGQAFDEFNNPLLWWMDSKPVAAFPHRVVVGPAHFGFAPGTGNTNMPIRSIAGVSQASSVAPLIFTTQQLHNFAVGDTVYFSGLNGLVGTSGSGALISQVNGRQFLISAIVSPVSFAVTDLNGLIPDSTSWTAYLGGGAVRKQNVPPNALQPTVQIAWSDDGGVNYVPPQLRALGAQGQSEQLIRCFLTGSMTPYGRIWRIQVSDPVYVAFKGADMPRIGKREAA